MVKFIISSFTNNHTEQVKLYLLRETKLKTQGSLGY